MSQNILERIPLNLKGTSASADEIRQLSLVLPIQITPEWLLDILRLRHLGGVSLSIDRSRDNSGIGVEMIWLRPSQMISEARHAEPGKSLYKIDLLPIGSCALGSGDPYFLDLRKGLSDPPVVRAPHDEAVVSPYPPDKLEIISKKLSDFFECATFL